MIIFRYFLFFPRDKHSNLVFFFFYRFDFVFSQYENGKKILLFFIHDDDAL